MRLEQPDRDIFMIHGFIDHDQCMAQIERAEAEGFDEAPVSTKAGPQMLKAIRNNHRVMFDDVGLSQALWAQLKPELPPKWSTYHRNDGRHWEAVGLNERLRYYRYDPGHRFKPHADGWFERADGERSFLTLLLYLNDQMMGGQTRVITRGGESIEITPAPGLLLCFEHGLMHEGAIVETGRKYVLRSDVMYRRLEDRDGAGDRKRDLS